MKTNIKEGLTEKYVGGVYYNNKAEYEIHTLGGDIYNLSNILNRVYFHPTSNYISIKILDLKTNKVIFYQSGVLTLQKSPITTLYSYFIKGKDLETVLFDNTHKTLEIDITLKGNIYANEAPDFI